MKTCIVLDIRVCQCCLVFCFVLLVCFFIFFFFWFALQGEVEIDDDDLSTLEVRVFSEIFMSELFSIH